MLLSTAWQLLMSCNVAACGVSAYVAVHQTFQSSFVLTRNSSLINGDGIPWVSENQSSCFRFSANASAIPRLLSMATPSTLNSMLYSLSSIEAEHLLILGNDLTVKEKTLIAEQVRASTTSAVEMNVRNQHHWSLEEYIEPIIAFIIQHAIFEVSLLISDHDDGADFVAGMLSHSKLGAWKIASVIILGEEETDEPKILQAHLSASEMTIICCGIDSARRVFLTLKIISELYGFSNPQSLWIMALQDDAAVGKEEIQWERLIVYSPVVSGTLEVKLDAATNTCFETAKMKRADFHQLWRNQMDGYRLRWHLIDSFGRAAEEETSPNTQPHDVFKNPQRMQVRVAISAYPPETMTEDLQPGHVCFHGSKLGYRFTNATSNATSPICVYGFAIDMLDLLEKELNFKSVIYQVRDYLYGSFNKTTKNWNGIVNEIIQGHAHLTPSLAVTKTREEHIQFSPPHLPFGYGIIYSNMAVQKNTANASGIGGPFSNKLWGGLFGVIFLTTIVLWGLDRVSPYGRHQTDVLGFSSKGPPQYNIQHSLTATWGMFTKGEIVDSRPRSLSARLTMLVISFAATVVVSIYSANLVVFLVRPEDSIPLSGIRDPKLSDPHTNIKLATTSGTSAETRFQNSRDLDLRSLHDKMKPYNVETFDEGMEKLRSGVIDALFESKPNLVYAASKDKTCSLKVLPVEYDGSGIAFACAKTLPWKASLLKAISKITSNGAAERSALKWFSSSPCKNDDVLFLPLSFHHMSIAFAALGGTASLVILLNMGGTITRVASSFFRQDSLP